MKTRMKTKTVFKVIIAHGPVTQEMDSRQRRVKNGEVHEVQKTIFRGELGENVFSVKRKRDKVQEPERRPGTDMTGYSEQQTEVGEQRKCLRRGKK